MTERWYYQMLMEEFGPVTTDQLNALVADGTLTSTDQVRRDSSEQWILIREISEELGSAHASELEMFSELPRLEDDPEHIDDLSQLTFSFEESSSSPKPKFRNSDAGASREPVSRPTELPAAPVTLYYYQSLGQIMGPLPIEDLVQMAETGALHCDDLIQTNESDQWKRAGDVEELSASLMLADTVQSSGPTLSSTTQKRLGTAAAAAALAEKPVPALQNVVAPVAPPTADAAAVSKEPNEPTVTDRAKSDSSAGKDSSAGTKSSANNKAGRRTGSQKKEDALLNEIFEDVFSEEEPVRTPQAFNPVTTSAMGAAGAAAMGSPSVASSPSSPPSYSPPTPAPYRGPVPVHTKSRSSSTDWGPILKVAAAVLLVAVIGGGGYYVVPAIFNGDGPEVQGYVDRLKTAAETLKTLGDSPSKEEWKKLADTKEEFTGMYNEIMKSGKTSGRIPKCKAAASILLRVLSTADDDLDFRKRMITAYHSAVDLL